MLLQHLLPYQANPLNLFERLRSLAWPVLLDSGNTKQGRYDIIAADPFIQVTSTIRSSKLCTRVVSPDGTTLFYDNPFDVLAHLLQKYHVPSQHKLPFTGGIIGYWSYELGYFAHGIGDNLNLIQDATLPLMQIGFYDWTIVTDHQLETSTLVSEGIHSMTRWKDLCARVQTALASPTGKFMVSSPIKLGLSTLDYTYAFDEIQRYISQGDCYQVNLAQRFSAQAKGDSWCAYTRLRTLSPAPFMAYLSFDELSIMSASPERFLSVQNGEVEACPIKGTRPRGRTEQEDALYRHELAHSTKDKAENIMIVDLLRNDLSKTCQPGSVKVLELLGVHSYTNVHHLVSRIHGKLIAHQSALDVLRHAFPGGSITGAPKIRAMQIIQQLEPYQRGVYCGAIGYISFNGNMDTNIAIRTATHCAQELVFFAGGGIVCDSVAQEEYDELMNKASHLLKMATGFNSEHIA